MDHGLSGVNMQADLRKDQKISTQRRKERRESQRKILKVKNVLIHVEYRVTDKALSRVRS